MDQALHNLQAVLRGSGMGFGNVVWMNIYLTNTHNLPAMEEAYWKLIGPPPRADCVDGCRAAGGSHGPDQLHSSRRRPGKRFGRTDGRAGHM